MDLLIKLARAFDTKGYPDDKNPDHWKTINHAPAHIDKNGNIDGGAGGKFNNKPWTSAKHPHKPESYPKDPLESLAEATKPQEPEEKPVTSEDLEEAWKKVVKYKVAMNQSKSQKTYEKHSENLTKAVKHYMDLEEKSGDDVVKKKHNASNMAKHAQIPWEDLPKNQPQQDPLSSLAQATTINSQDIYEAFDNVMLAGESGDEQKAQKALNDYSELYNALPDDSKDAHTSPAALVTSINFLHNMHLTAPGNELPVEFAKEPEPTPPAPTNPNAPNGGYTPNPENATIVPYNQFIMATQNLNNFGYLHSKNLLDADDYEEMQGLIDTVVNSTNYDNYTLQEKKKIWAAFEGKSEYINIVKNAQNIVGEYLNGKQNNASTPLEALASATTKQGMEAFPNGLQSAGMTKKFKEASMAKIKAAQSKSSYSSNDTYQQLGNEAGEVWKKATKLQKACAYEYTTSFNKYNEPLRGKEYYGGDKGVGKVDFDNVYQNPNQREKTDALTELIHKTSLGEDRIVYRGVGAEGMDKAFNVPLDLLMNGSDADLKQALTGLEWTDHGFGSVGADKGSGFSAKIQMEIYAPKGTKGIYAEPFSAYGADEGTSWDGDTNSWYKPGSENEIILQRGTRYKIMEVKKVGGKVKLVMQIISQDPYKLP